MQLTGAKYARQPTIPPLPDLFKHVGAAAREATSVDAGTKTHGRNERGASLRGSSIQIARKYVETETALALWWQDEQNR